MATTYTSLLWEITTGGSGEDVGPGPDVGLRWVVVDVEAWNPTVSFQDKLNGFQLQDNSGFNIANCSPLEARGYKEYRWQGRQVLDHPANLIAASNEEGWIIRVTGFELSLP